MQIISPEGDLLHEIKGVYSPEEFLDILTKFREMPTIDDEKIDSLVVTESLDKVQGIDSNAVGASNNGVQKASFFTVQLGAFRVFDNVINFRRELEKKLDTSLSIYESNEDGLFRIFIGQHTSKIEALDSWDMIKEQYVDYWLRGVKPSLKIFKLDVQ